MRPLLRKVDENGVNFEDKNELINGEIFQVFEKRDETAREQRVHFSSDDRAVLSYRVCWVIVITVIYHDVYDRDYTVLTRDKFFIH